LPTGGATKLAKLGWAVAASCAAAVLVIAAALDPDPRGFGTHTQLGLPPCAFAALTGMACPSCGLTTAFAYMARMDLTCAWHAHALGPLLYVLTVAMVPCCAFACVAGLPLAATLQRLRVPALAVIIAVAALVHFVVRAALTSSTAVAT